MKRYIDSFKMLLEDWLKDLGIPDALWRTAFLDILFGEVTTDECYESGFAYRHPAMKRDCILYGAINTCSRDQVIMDFCSRVLNKAPIPYLRNKFSDKFRQTMDMRAWVKAIKGNKWSCKVFLLNHRIFVPMKLRWNELLWLISEKLYWKLRWPYYSFHLLSWMIFVLPDSKSKQRLQWTMLKYVRRHDGENILLRQHNGDRFSTRAIDAYEPKTDFRPQRMGQRLDPGIKLLDYDGPFQIDKDILYAVRKINLKAV